MNFLSLTFCSLTLLVLNVDSFYSTYGLSPVYQQEKSPWIQVTYTTQIALRKQKYQQPPAQLKKLSRGQIFNY
jgi:hypothetical protein